MNVPLLDLGPQHEPLQAEILEALGDVIRSRRFILGPEVEKLEGRLASYCGVEHAIGVSSGSDALLVSLMAVGIRQGDEVLTSPFSFFATAGAIARLGATPVFVDIDPETYHIDPSRIEEAVTPRSRAILPIHLYGQCADMAPILELARRRGLVVVEDAAQAVGAEYRDGRRAGSMGLLGCLSFYPTKNLGALGDAGMVLTGDGSLADKVRLLRVHGSGHTYYHDLIGGNFRIDALQAAVLNVKFSHLDEWTKERRAIARRYGNWLKEAGLLDKVGWRVPRNAIEPEGTVRGHVFQVFVLRAPDRDRLRQFLKERGVGTEVYYPVPLHLQKCFSYLGHKDGDFPESERAARETLALPVYPGLTEEQQRFVVEAIRAFYA